MSKTNPKSYIITLEDFSVNPNQLNLLNYLKRVINQNDELNIVDIKKKEDESFI